MYFYHNNTKCQCIRLCMVFF